MGTTTGPKSVNSSKFPEPFPRGSWSNQSLNAYPSTSKLHPKGLIPPWMLWLIKSPTSQLMWLTSRRPMKALALQFKSFTANLTEPNWMTKMKKGFVQTLPLLEGCATKMSSATDARNLATMPVNAAQRYLDPPSPKSSKEALAVAKPMQSR